MKYLLVILSFILVGCATKKVGPPSDLNGYGKYEYPSYGVYEGEFKNGYPHGKGTFTFVKKLRNRSQECSVNKIKARCAKPYKYSGEFDSSKNSKDKNGNMRFSLFSLNSDSVIEISFGKENEFSSIGPWTYKGEWKGDLFDGVIHGQGTSTYPNGDMWIGEWKDDMAWNGKGVYKHPHGFYTYQGELINGKFNDKDGFYRKSHGTKGYSEYRGVLVNGIRNGQGKSRETDSSIFVGEYKDDEPFTGHYYFRTGTRYKAVIENGKILCKNTGKLKIYLEECTKKGYLYEKTESDGVTLERILPPKLKKRS
jgi:hypothetical protein